MLFEQLIYFLNFYFITRQLKPEYIVFFANCIRLLFNHNVKIINLQAVAANKLAILTCIIRSDLHVFTNCTSNRSNNKRNQFLEPKNIGIYNTHDHLGKWALSDHK